MTIFKIVFNESVQVALQSITDVRVIRVVVDKVQIWCCVDDGVAAEVFGSNDDAIAVALAKRVQGADIG